MTKSPLPNHQPAKPRQIPTPGRNLQDCPTQLPTGDPEHTDDTDTDAPPGLTWWWDSDSDDEAETATVTTQSTGNTGNTNAGATIVSNTLHNKNTSTSTQSHQTHNHATRAHNPPVPEAILHQNTLVPTQVITTNSHVTYQPIIGLQPADDLPDPHNNFYIGDSLQLPKNVGTTRLYFQNLNGINLSQLGNWVDTCSHLRDMEVDIALIAEHKLDTNQPRVLKKLYDQARTVLGQGSYTINATSTPITSPTMYKPGGVLSLIHGGTKGRILQSGNDPLGRWSYTTLRRNSGPPITVIVTYQVVDVDPKHAGPTTYATQLFSVYLQEGRHHPEKLRYHHASDLLTFVKQCQERGEWIILAGDMNEVIGLDTRGMSKLLGECGLLDACLERHGLTDFTTYQRGNRVIDYILVDRNVMQSIQSIGYEPFNIHIISDHRGIFIDLAMPQCFGSNTLPLQPLHLRDLSTKRSHQIAPYFRDKQKHLEDHRWHHKIQELQDKM